MKLNSITLPTGIQYNFTDPTITARGVEFSQHDGYVEYWNPETLGLDQLYFDITPPEAEAYANLYMGKRDLTTGEPIGLSDIGKRVYRQAVDIKAHLSALNPGFCLVSVSYFYRPFKGLYASSLTLYPMANGQQRWRYAVEKCCYFQSELKMHSVVEHQSAA